MSFSRLFIPANTHKVYERKKREMMQKRRMQREYIRQVHRRFKGHELEFTEE